jgi:NAD(P)-dependent dehydrogenase (short-subunit alcohol dehydrogenase family)
MVFALFIGMEFCYYWYHRASHRVRFFWATHAVHHSPNQLTLSTAYRLGLIGKLTGSTLFFAPLVWLGVKPEVVLLTLFLNLMYQEGIDTYFLNVVRPTRLVVPHMKKQRGVIINISTAWALEPGVMFPTSAVALAGLSAFTKLFADAHASENIRMNNVPPGWIDSLPATEERRQSVPMQRYGTSEEIAATVAFLASDGAAYITGQNIRVDGGLTRSI